jgi:uncharacterized peroxidase-related enzyme
MRLLNLAPHPVNLQIADRIPTNTYVMSDYKISLSLVEPEAADEEQAEILDSALKAYGMIPNMYKAMANHPSLLKTYMHGYEQFRSGSRFDDKERDVILLTISSENNCTYCKAAHSMSAEMMAGVPQEITEAIRNNTPVPDQKLNALSVFTRVMVKKRGNPSQEDVDSFLAAGYTEEDILVIILAISVKTISNYTNHLFHTELDPGFKSVD